MLSKAQIEELKKKMLADKKEMEDQLSKFAKKDSRTKGNYRSIFPKIGSQIDENAQEVQEYERNISLEHSLEEELTLVNQALDRIEKGSFGKCKVCGKTIGYDRLKVRPHAVMCIKCKSKNELGSS